MRTRPANPATVPSIQVFGDRVEICRLADALVALADEHPRRPEMITHVTASRLGLLARCQAWPHLPADPDHTSASAQLGRALHRLSDEWVRTETASVSRAASDFGLSDPATRTLEKMWSHLWAYLDQIPEHLSLTSEVAVAWDPTTDFGRELSPGEFPALALKSRAYADNEIWADICARTKIHPSSVPGTADLVLEVPTASPCGSVVPLTIYDICSGRSDKTDQLLGLGLAFARARKVDIVRLITLRVDEDGCREEVRVLDFFELATIASSIRERIARIGTDPRPGVHCTERFCPALGSCPATTSAVAQTLETHPDPEVRENLSPAEAPESRHFSLPILSDGHAAWLLARERIVRRQAETVREALKAWASVHGGIRTELGSLWRCFPATRAVWDASRCEELLRELGATPDQIESCRKQVDSSAFREVP